jgi:branched-chain amino acid transport system permease protein
MQTFGAVIAPEIASMTIYALLAAVLILRPAGLFPAKS